MANDGSRSDILHVNERMKYLSGMLATWGNALLVAALATWAVKGFNEGFDAFVLLYLVIAGLCLWSGYHILGAMEAENEHE